MGGGLTALIFIGCKAGSCKLFGSLFKSFPTADTIVVINCPQRHVHDSASCCVVDSPDVVCLGCLQTPALAQSSVLESEIRAIALAHGTVALRQALRKFAELLYAQGVSEAKRNGPDVCSDLVMSGVMRLDGCILSLSGSFDYW